MKRTHRVLMIEDDIDSGVIKLLETYSKHGPNHVSLSRTVNKFKDQMKTMLNTSRHIEDKSYHVTSRELLIYTRKFMCSNIK